MHLLARIVFAVTFFYARCYLWTKHTIAFARNAQAALNTMDAKQGKSVSQARQMIYIFVGSLAVITSLQVCISSFESKTMSLQGWPTPFLFLFSF
jgi:hypothetical protein